MDQHEMEELANDEIRDRQEVPLPPMPGQDTVSVKKPSRARMFAAAFVVGAALLVVGAVIGQSGGGATAAADPGSRPCGGDHHHRGVS